VTLTDIVPSIVANLLVSAALNRTAQGAPLVVRGKNTSHPQGACDCMLT
jgi:hypothetical protein